MRRYRLKSRKDKPKLAKVGNLGFLLAVPSIFILALLSLIIVISLIKTYGLNTSYWALFSMGFCSTLLMLRTIKAQRFRTLVHELKHAVVVILTGNSVTNIRIGRDTGHVNYMMRLDKMHFGPIIVLAPYFLPLFSFPCLMLAIIFEPEYRLAASFILGLTFGSDIATGFEELHPHQTDLKKIFGGFLVAGSFIAGAHLLWTCLCLIWVAAGRSGYLLAWDIIVSIVTQLLLS
jgi:hypothetical protein